MRSWRESPVVKSTCCSSKDLSLVPTFSSNAHIQFPAPLSSLHRPHSHVTLLPGRSDTAFYSYLHICSGYSHRCTGTYTGKNKMQCKKMKNLIRNWKTSQALCHASFFPPKFPKHTVLLCGSVCVCGGGGREGVVTQL